jgi:hypothetical protein
VLRHCMRLALARYHKTHGGSDAVPVLSPSDPAPATPTSRAEPPAARPSAATGPAGGRASGEAASAAAPARARRCHRRPAAPAASGAKTVAGRPPATPAGPGQGPGSPVQPAGASEPGHRAPSPVQPDLPGVAAASAPSACTSGPRTATLAGHEAKPGRPPDKKPGRPPIPAAVRRAVWRRDGGQCAWLGPDGRRCGSTHQLQYDHIVPAALGGVSSEGNVRIACGCHNRLEAERMFGQAAARHRRGATPAASRDASGFTVELAAPKLGDPAPGP